MKPAPDGDVTPIAHAAARCRRRSAITGVGTIVLGVLPGIVMRFGDLQDLTGAFGR